MGNLHSMGTTSCEPLMTFTVPVRDGTETSPPLPPIPHGTPMCIRHASAPSYRTDGLKHGRTVVLGDLKLIPIIQDGVFKKLLPPLQLGVSVGQAPYVRGTFARQGAKTTRSRAPQQAISMLLYIAGLSLRNGNAPCMRSLIRG
ncbi:hypothetical protein FRB94_008213 [Tulasnella sp. JGI-2019a]|nr:hypothetical protein FRB93_004369 [Tulasnella sp. JGI-2019a]KAG8996542.1 hypothetical protein FRB94_008213 [Tulasnella sp. JGI-2019a]